MSSSNSPCAACKFLRRKCTQECVFAPYFPPDNPQRFTCVHRVFGASNVAKLLNELPPSQREDAVKSLAYEADARLKDPVYGCVGLISLLQQRLKQIQGELYNAKKELSTYIEPQAMPPGMPAILPPGIMPQQHPTNPYLTPLYPFNMGPHSGQLVIRDPQQQQHQQQQIMEAQQYAAAMAAREQQEMLRNYEQQQQQQQQQEFFRFNRGFEVGSSSGAGGAGFNNQMATAAAPTEVLVSPSLGLAPYDQPYQIQQQQAEHHHPHPHDQLQAQAAQLLLTTQQPQPQQPHQQQPENEEGQGENVVGSSC